MALAINETLILVNRSMLQSREGLIRLQTFLKTDGILKNTIVRGYEDDGIVSVFPKNAQQRLTLKNNSFQYFVAQKIVDGYIYASVESLQKIVEKLLAEFQSKD